jgi:hypothetical protein
MVRRGFGEPLPRAPQSLTTATRPDHSLGRLHEEWHGRGCACPGCCCRAGRDQAHGWGSEGKPDQLEADDVGHGCARCVPLTRGIL